MFFRASIILLAQVLSYWAYQRAPQTVVQPIFLVSEMVIPALIGLYLFSERKTIDAVEKALLVLGIIGGVIISFSF